MSDITERLRSFRSLSWFVHANDKYEISLRDANSIVACGIEAADEIDRLTAQLAEAERKLGEEITKAMHAEARATLRERSYQFARNDALEDAAKVAALVMSECFEAVTAIDAVDLPTETQQWNRHLYQGGYRASTDIVAAIRALKGKTATAHVDSGEIGEGHGDNG